MPTYSLSSGPGSCTLVPFISVTSLALLFLSAIGAIVNAAIGPRVELADGKYYIVKGMLFVASALTILYIFLHILVARRNYPLVSTRNCSRLPAIGSAVVTARICLLIWIAPLISTALALAELTRKVGGREIGVGMVAHLAMMLALTTIIEINFIILIVVHETARRPFDLPGITSHDISCRVSDLFPDDDEDGHISVSRQGSLHNANTWCEKEKIADSYADLLQKSWPRQSLQRPAFPQSIVSTPQVAILASGKADFPRSGHGILGHIRSSDSSSSGGSGDSSGDGAVIRDFTDDWARLASETGYASPQIAHPPMTQPRGGRPMIKTTARRDVRGRSKGTASPFRSQLSTMRSAEERPLPTPKGAREMRPWITPSADQSSCNIEGVGFDQYRVPGAFV